MPESGDASHAALLENPGAPPARRQKEIEDVIADGERYRLFPPRPPGSVDDDFLDPGVRPGVRALADEQGLARDVTPEPLVEVAV